MNKWSDLLRKHEANRNRPKGVMGRPPTLSPEQCKDVIELVEERIKVEEKIRELQIEIRKANQRIVELRDRRAALTNSQIGNVFNVSHNIIRQIILGKYRWTQVDAGHDE